MRGKPSSSTIPVSGADAPTVSLPLWLGAGEDVGGDLPGVAGRHDPVQDHFTRSFPG
jgi:hypothetical protein